MNCLKCCLKINDPKSSHYRLHPQCFLEWFDAPITAEFVNLQRRSSTSSEQAKNLTKQDTSFFHGKFKKYSAELNGVSYILKMRQSEAPELPEVEYLCNQIGYSLGVPVAEFYLIDFNDDITFVTKNFIKPDAPIDLQHIYHFRSDDQHSVEGLIRVVREKTHQPRDIKVLIDTMLFDSLIGNHDRHGRNLAFIVTAKNHTLSPIYDNVSYLSLESGNMLKADFNPTGKICTSTTYEPSMRDYINELKRLGYEQSIQDFYNKIKLPHLLQLIDESFCSLLMKHALKALITKRFEELKNARST